MLNALAIAIQGIGFSAPVFALQGFSEVEYEQARVGYYLDQSVRRKKKSNDQPATEIDLNNEYASILFLLS